MLILYITTKDIIDQHFTDNYKRYQRVCYRYYRGRYLFDDLLNEAYFEFLKVKEDVILKFHAMDKLYNIGLKIIRSLYQKRFSTKKYEGASSTSALYESKTITLHIDRLDLSNESYDESQDLLFDEVSKKIDKGLQSQDDWFCMTVFVKSQTESIFEMSKKTRISRPYLTKAYKEAILKLKQ